MFNLLSRFFRKLSASDGWRQDVPKYSVHPPGLTFLTDVTVGRWIEKRLTGPPESMSRLVPEGYAAYARVLNPAHTAAGEPLRWSTVSDWSGRVYHPLMSFEGISRPVDGRGTGPAPWGRDPEHGRLDEGLPRKLAALLFQFTDTPEQCYFGVWEGYGQYSGGTTLLTSDGSGRPLPTPSDIRKAQRIRGCGRNYLLYTGELRDISGFYTNFRSEPPNIWWPADRAWFVATDIDLDSTYIGASQECIDALLQHPTLEAVPAEYLASVAMEADIINLGDPI